MIGVGARRDDGDDLAVALRSALATAAVTSACRLRAERVITILPTRRRRRTSRRRPKSRRRRRPPPPPPPQPPPPPRRRRAAGCRAPCRRANQPSAAAAAADVAPAPRSRRRRPRSAGRTGPRRAAGRKTNSSIAPQKISANERAAAARAGRRRFCACCGLDRALLGRLGRRLQLRDDRVGAGVDAARIIVGAEARRDLLADDLARQGVGR